METKNEFSLSLVKFVINKYYKGYRNRFYEDLYSYGLQALYDADKSYDPTKNTKPFEYYAVCVIKRRMYMFVRDRISKTYLNTTFTDNTAVLDILGKTHQYNLHQIDLYRAIKTLTEEEKNILYLMYEKEYTLYQIADLYKFSYQTAFRKHKRILIKLKELLQYNEL